MIRFLYKNVLKPILFKIDPEVVHDAFVVLGANMGKFQAGRILLGLMYKYTEKDIEITVDGITYKSPVMLAAGFDYNGQLAHVLDCLSFGGDEIGSVTARPCEGNPKPRLKRMIKSKSLVVYKGLKNQGVDRIIARLKNTTKPEGFVWGISIAKTNDPGGSTFEGGIEDYHYSLSRLAEENMGDFYTINISCPNVHGGENFAEPQRLEKLLDRLMEVEHDKPVYAKMPINQPWEEFNELLHVLDKAGVHGVVIGNLNKNYSDADFQEEAPTEYRGGLSGKLCQRLSTDLIRQTKNYWGDRFTIIGCGGILTVEDAMEKLDAGADLLQLITGMIFEGPHLMKDICAAYASRAEKKSASVFIPATG
ncbi:quinone-dependent dihydroorotate dehydrogenase [Litoribacter ruber]|uniref:quinone-dependent dihydroorotate dehydrogenase n=1 Tax=Litoribacter ruber TaxID=702568 RepID=UPI001BDA2C89|nr:quinone-dependent dihydroorotate dehydrogenase [Litoribacter ruber]MBT0811597.1 quinone-dependent dihydroorotate dehydrogenase [Litoribacter ruber]